MYAIEHANTTNNRTVTCVQTHIFAEDGERIQLAAPLVITFQTGEESGSGVKVVIGPKEAPGVYISGKDCRELALMFCEAAGLEAVARK